MLTAYGTIERAVQAMKQGAYDFIPKPFEPERLVLTVQKALELERLKREVEFLSEAVSERYRQVVGQSATMQQALEMAKKVAGATRPCYCSAKAVPAKSSLPGPSTTGSARGTKPFIAINCVALSKDLVESELFGHEKGASLGPTSGKEGNWNSRRGDGAPR